MPAPEAVLHYSSSTQKGVIDNRLRRASGRVGPFSAVGVASVVPRIRILALRQLKRGGNRRSPTLPRARSFRTIGRAPARPRQREAEHPTPRLRTRHAGGALAQRKYQEQKWPRAARLGEPRIRRSLLDGSRGRCSRGELRERSAGTNTLALGLSAGLQNARGVVWGSLGKQPTLSWHDRRR
jgi:hypothetical protein